jgi:WD40 repeat protein
MRDRAADLRYDAFVSYSRAADGLLAPALQAGLQTLGKPWYARRALRVFRDKTSLSASPGLWPAIERALAGSRFFVLLASPAAARSHWVDQEVSWWRAHRDSSTMLIALTDGELSWDDERGDFDDAAPIPASLRGWFGGEPLWTDLRWARELPDVSLRNPRFRDAAADLAAPLQGMPKDELIGEDIRQHKRTRRLARAAVVTLLVLTAAAIVGALIAVLQSNRARAQEHLATSRYLAGQASSHLDTQPDLALLLGLEGYRIDHTAEARSSVLAVYRRNARLARIIYGDPRGLLSVAVGPGGAVAAAGRDGSVTLWDSRSDEPVGRRLALRGSPVTSVAFSPTGQTIAASDEEGAIRRWDARSGRAIGTSLRAGGGAIWDIAFSPDGRWLASAGEDGSLRLWDARRGVPRGGPMEGHRRSATVVAFSADGRRLVSGGRDGTIRLWDVLGAKALLKPLRGHDGIVSSVTFSPGGQRIASGGEDGTVRFWDARTGRSLGPALEARQGTVFSVAYRRDGAVLASAGEDGSIRLWSARHDHRLQTTLRTGAEAVASLAFERDRGVLVSAGEDGTVKLWNVTGDDPLARSLAPDRSSLWSLAFSPDRRTLAAAGVEHVARWDARTGRRVRDLPVPGIGLLAIAFDPQGGRLATGGTDGTVRLVRTAPAPASARPLPRRRDAWVTSLAFSPDGTTLASADDDGVIRLWNLRSRQPRSRLDLRPGGRVLSVAFAPDSRSLASGEDDGTVRIWNSASGAELRRLQAHHGAVLSVAYGRRLLATAGADATVRLWEPHTGAPVGTPLRGHHGSVRSVAIADRPAGGSIVASGGQDHTVRLWDTRTGEPIGLALEGHSAAVHAVAFSSDGRALASASEDGGVMLWSPLLWSDDIRSVRSRLCDAVGRNLSAQEWRRFLPGRSYERTCARWPGADG